jgi:hypothetical protein
VAKATLDYLIGRKAKKEATQGGGGKANSRSKRKIGRLHKEVETTADLIENGDAPSNIRDRLRFTAMVREGCNSIYVCAGLRGTV